tara:strand:+ start:1318 stop:2484 length:1167 start_codon:yes stop_codon:yes gene_type:complete
MSTIKVTNIEHESTGNGGIQLDSSGHVTVDGVQMPTTGPLSNRNLIINGAMQVAQRGTSSTSQHNSNNYGLDRWQVVCPNTSAVLVHSQESTGGPDGFENWLKISPSTADTAIAANNYSSVQQKIEGYNFAPARYGTADAKNVSVSFKFKTNKAGTYCVCHRNEAANRNYIHEFTPVADGSWQTITYTVEGDTTGTWATTNGLGWRFELFLANGTNNQSSTTDTWFQGQYYHATPNQVNFLDSTSNELGITGVQVELGTKSTPFEYRSYGDELAKCRRYYFQSKQQGDTYEGCYYAYGISTNRIGAQVRLPIEMRTDPSFVLIRPVDGVQDGAHRYYGVGSGATGDVSFTSVGFADRGRLGFPYITLNNNSIVQGAGYLFHIEAHAEL